MDLVAFGCGRLRPRGGDQRRGTVRLLKAAEMRLKTSGSAAGGSAAGGRNCSAGHGAREAGESRGAGSALSGLVTGWALLGAGLMLSSVKGGGENRSAPPPSRLCYAMRKRSPSNSRMRAGVCRRRTHVSRQ